MDESALAAITTIEQAVRGFETFAAMGLAVCITYLNLDRFRYRAKLREMAVESLTDLSKIEPTGLLTEVNKEEADLCQLLWFARLRDHDGVHRFLWRLWKRIEGRKEETWKDSRWRTDVEHQKPSGATGRLYSLVFAWHFDRLACLVLMITCGLIIAAAATSALGGYSWVGRLLSLVSPTPNTLFWWCTASVVVPLIFTRLGEFVVGWGQRKIQQAHKQLYNHIEDIAKPMRRAAANPEMTKPIGTRKKATPKKRPRG